MAVFFRIFKYARPFKVLSLCYFFFIFLAIFFGLSTYSLFIPLLKVLFNQEELNNLLLQINHWPTFDFTIDYFIKIFNYFFVKTIITYGKVGALYLLSGLFVLSTLLSSLFRYISDIAMARIRINVVYNLRLALFKKTLFLPFQCFTDKKNGDFMARMSTDIQEVEHTISDVLRLFLKETTQLLCYILTLCYISITFTYFTFIFLPISGYIISTITKKLKKWGNVTQESLGNLMHLITEALMGMRIIKVFGAENYIIKKFKKENRTYAFSNLSVAYKECLGAPISESLSVVAIAIVLSYGGKLIFLNSCELTASTFIAYIIICSQTLIPIKMISRYVTHIQRGLVAGQRIFNVLDDPVESVTFTKKLKYSSFKDKLVCNQVSFSYHSTGRKLHHITFEIKKGQTVALVGASGSGKSTILALLSGLYQPNSGKIEIDHIPLSQLDPYSIQRLFGVVTQEPVLFYDTVFNNIVFNKTQFTQEDVMKVAKLVLVHDCIMDMPYGYNTIIGENGNQLSSGQKQRICIARAILGDPPILMLDEATSTLDATSERIIQEGLQSFYKDKTFIIVAHRLSTIIHADKIIVLDDGKIVEEGTHASLLAKDGTYKKLFVLQQNGHDL